MSWFACSIQPDRVTAFWQAGCRADRRDAGKRLAKHDDPICLLTRDPALGARGIDPERVFARVGFAFFERNVSRPFPIGGAEDL
jgi:hypothetical protein